MSYLEIGHGLSISKSAWSESSQKIFTSELLALISEAHQRFNSKRLFLLSERKDRQKKWDTGELPTYLDRSSFAVKGKWKIEKIPEDYLQRRVEITGPVNDTKMVINMLSRNAEGFRADTAMLDFEDSMKPSFDHVLAGYRNVIDAASGILKYTKDGKSYELNPNDMAGLMVRVRGLHLDESNLKFNGEPVHGGLLDLIVCFFHTAKTLLGQNKTPKYYVPKCEHHFEARWWNDLFSFLESEMHFPNPTLRATFLIETLPAAFQIEEILYEIREHAIALNVGRWDKIFSDIKILRSHPDRISADRSEITLHKFWMDNYAKRLIKICHERGALAIGGMSAFTPGKDAETRHAQTEKVLADKQHEADMGHDGCWVSHPYFIGIAMKAFTQKNHIEITLKDFDKYPDLLMDGKGHRTLNGLRTNVRVGIAYLQGWNNDVGCVSWDNLMEDLATLEISRTQVWQWLHHKVRLDEGQVVTPELVKKLFVEELAKIISDLKDNKHEHLIYQFERAQVDAQNLYLKKELEDFLSTKSDVLTSTRENFMMTATQMTENWNTNPRWDGIERQYSADKVVRLRGSVEIEYSLARRGAERLWKTLNETSYVNALGALTGNQAVQQVRAGLESIYLSGWQVAADANLAGQMYPDQSLYPSDSVPSVVKRINNALIRADQINTAEGIDGFDWIVPIVADAEAGFGGALNAYELMKAMIEAGAAGVHFEDQLASEKKCGHLGGKVLISTKQFIKTLTAARLAADTMNVPTILVARTDADSAQLITSDADEYDHSYIDFAKGRSTEGFYYIKSGVDTAIKRGLAYAPFADLVWCETGTPDLEYAKKFAEGIKKNFPDKMLAYNCSPSFNWKKNLDDETIAKFQKELGAMGYKFQFVTLAGFHALNYSMFSLAHDYKTRGMSAYSDFQEAEFAKEKFGYTATKHQREVGTGYFDAVSSAICGGKSSTLALKGSTEDAQFIHH